MIESATAINTLRISSEADNVPPADEPVFILTASQLSALTTQTVQKAIQPLRDRISEMDGRIARLEEENASMRLKMASLESTEEQDVTRICLDVAQDRQRISKLESKPTGPAPTAPPQGEKTVARVAKIDEVLKSRGPTTLTQLEHILGICKATMTRLLGKLDMRRYELHARPGDAREKVLRLKAQIR
jgi:TolA-binding protein